MKFCFSLIILFGLGLFPFFSHAATCDADNTYCLIVDYLDNQVNFLVCHQKIKTTSTDSLCTDSSYTQKTQTDFYDKGQFGTETNQRNQEAVYTLAFLYQEPYSDYYQNEDILNRVVWALDYLRRSQSEKGGISEEGWMGIDYNDVDCDGEKNERSVKNNTEDNPTECDASDCAGDACGSSGYIADPEKGSGTSVSGFTYYAAAQVINLLYDDSDFQNLLEDEVAGSGDGDVDDPRSEMYTRLVTNAAYFLTHSGRGHAPNQDLINLLALHALNDAYDKLEGLGYTVPDSDLDDLMDTLELDSGDSGYDATTSLSALREEILYGSPDAAIDGDDGDESTECDEGGNGFDRWFSDKALLLEKGYGSESVKACKSNSVGYDGGYGWVALRALSLLKDWDPEVEDFLEDYISWFQYFFYVDLSLEKGGYQISAISRRQYQEGELKFSTAGALQDYPAMKTIFNAALEHFMHDPDGFFDPPSSKIYTGLYVTAELLRHWVTPSSSTYVLPLNRFDDGDPSDFEDFQDTLNDQDGDTITLLKITNTDDTVSGVKFKVNYWWNGKKEYYFGSSTATITLPLPEKAPCDLCPGTSSFTCLATDGDVLEEVTSSTGCDGSSLVLEVDVTTPTSVSYDVDNDDDGEGDFLDTDDDNDSLSDVEEESLGTSSILTDTDGDGLSDSSEIDLGTNPSDTDSDDDGLSDYDEINTYSTDPLDTDSDNDGLSDAKEIEAGSDPNVYTDWLTPILSILMEGDEDGDTYDSVDDGGDDCDDDDSSVYPGATETCGDGIDQDCDGADTECVITYTVTKTVDTNDGKCTESDCSLREAMAVAKADTSGYEIDIVFDISSTDSGCNITTGLCTISPTKALPALNRGNTVIDGEGLIVIDGTSAGSTTKGFTINNSSSNVIANIGIQNFGSHGIYITGASSSENEVSGCYIGTDSSGSDQSNGGSGIYIASGSATISKNVIAYNLLKGIHLTSTLTLGVVITQNSLHDNVSTGIVLASGANNSKAKPVISTATASGSTVTITGTATAGDTIEIFNASTDSEGQTYIGETTTDSSGTWTYTTNTTTAPKWSKIITTATDTTNGTSQFSATKTVK